MSYSVVIPSRSIDNLKTSVESLKNEHFNEVFIMWDATERYLDYDEIECFTNPNIALCQTTDPFIFARNVNLGITTYRHDDIFIMNDDAVLEYSGTLDKLAECASNAKDYGVVAATINGTVGNPEQKRLTRGIDLRETKERLCFMAVYIRREVINSVGLLDERFVGYGFEDDDYCKRVQEKGYKLGVYEGCSFEHDSLPSTFRTKNPKVYDLVEQNRKLYIEKYA